MFLTWRPVPKLQCPACNSLCGPRSPVARRCGHCPTHWPKGTCCWLAFLLLSWYHPLHYHNHHSEKDQFLLFFVILLLSQLFWTVDKQYLMFSIWWRNWKNSLVLISTTTFSPFSVSDSKAKQSMIIFSLFHQNVSLT